MGENIKEIDNVSEFVEIITNSSELEKLSTMFQFDDRKEHSLFFRGHAAKYNDLDPVESAIPSIFRKKNFINNEHNIFKEFILRNPDDFKNDKSTFEKLARMQHYGLPTRLLDITSNALIALYMACSSHIPDCLINCLEYNEGMCLETGTTDCKCNGYVIVFKIQKDKIKYYDSDTVSVISNIARRPPDDDNRGLNFNKYKMYYDSCHKNSRNRSKKKSKSFKLINKENKDLKIFNDYHPIQYLLHEIKEEKPYFKDYIQEEHIHDIVCVKPLLNNRRIIRQDGAFLLFGMKENKESYPEIKDQKHIETEIIKINGIRKKDILDQLANLGITEDKVYPEMEAVAKYLKADFSK